MAPPFKETGVRRGTLNASKASDGGGWQAPSCQGGGSAGCEGGGTLVAPVTARGSLALPARTVVRALGGVCVRRTLCSSSVSLGDSEGAWSRPAAVGAGLLPPRCALGLSGPESARRRPAWLPGWPPGHFAWGPPAARPLPRVSFPGRLWGWTGAPRARSLGARESCRLQAVFLREYVEKLPGKATGLGSCSGRALV